MFGEELQGDEAAELDVLGLINDTHPATTQLLEDAVMRRVRPNMTVALARIEPPYLTEIAGS